MLHDLIDDSPASRLGPIHRWPWGAAQWVVLCLLLLLGVAAAWAQQRAATPNLGNPHRPTSGWKVKRKSDWLGMWRPPLLLQNGVERFDDFGG
ncbi:hypothetical protein NPS45_24475 [Pseudomonas putida]|uniref:hypothetical protein n=1 Tax=Pseudomonas putida TaxID=303 RepID=UPI002363A57D|nr:hypothetical protein [Pseudomonas putida]MDD2076947.1 hypothetical protein [Pseudomonas putida]